MEDITIYTFWDESITTIISNTLLIPYGDAAGIVEAQSFKMSQCWALGDDAETTANKIMND